MSNKSKKSRKSAKLSGEKQTVPFETAIKRLLETPPKPRKKKKKKKTNK